MHEIPILQGQTVLWEKSGIVLASFPEYQGNPDFCGQDSALVTSPVPSARSNSGQAIENMISTSSAKFHFAASFS